MSKRIDLLLDEDIYFDFLYRKSRQIGRVGVSLQQLIRNVLEEYCKNNPVDSIRFKNFLESKGLESSEMKEDRLMREKRDKDRM